MESVVNIFLGEKEGHILPSSNYKYNGHLNGVSVIGRQEQLP